MRKEVRFSPLLNENDDVVSMKRSKNCQRNPQLSCRRATSCFQLYIFSANILIMNRCIHKLVWLTINPQTILKKKVIGSRECPKCSPEYRSVMEIKVWMEHNSNSEEWSSIFFIGASSPERLSTWTVFQNAGSQVKWNKSISKIFCLFGRRAQMTDSQ